MEAKNSQFNRENLTMKKLSIVIVSYNVGKYLKNCLESINKTAGSLQPEIIVVDNNSTDDTDTILKTNFPQLQVTTNSKNCGFAKAANMGMKISQGEFVALLNPDTVVLDCAFTGMLEYLENNPGVGITGPKLIDPDGSLQYSCRSFPSWSTYFSNRQSLLNRIFPSNKWSKKYLLKEKDHQQIQEVDWISGCCLLLRKKMLEEIGYLDKDFFMYIEDVDLARRAKSKNWKVVYYPPAQLIHFKSQSVIQNKIGMLIEHHRSMYKYYLKHYPKNWLVKAGVFSAVFLRLGSCVLGMKLKS